MTAIREKNLKRLQGQTFDLVIIGGGATGTGIALDATLRGLKVALLESNDFSSGTSSRSTKLIHGGLRYLEAAVKQFDFKQIHLVQENLNERETILKIAPHLTRILPILVPVYSWFQLVYFYPGLKLYDWLAKKRKIGKSHFVSRKKTLEKLPYLRKKGLKGGLVFYDLQFDDSRMNLSLALTAEKHGATLANYVKCTGLIKEKGKVTGIKVIDKLSNRAFDILGKVVVNAAGPFGDEIRLLDNPKQQNALATSAGTHILLDGKYTPKYTSLLIPKTSDGRVLFIVPWKGSTLVGTTEVSTSITKTPTPGVDEINYLLKHLKDNLDIDITKEDIKAAWTGIRPLLAVEDVDKTAKLPRDYKIEISPSNLYSILGGKWSSYRKMASDLVDRIANVTTACTTDKTALIGAAGYSHDLPQKLARDFDLPGDIAHNLARSYGGRAHIVIKGGKIDRLHPDFPYITAEIPYAMEHEFACNPQDFLQRRIHLGFLNEEAAKQIRPLVEKLMRKS